MAVTNIGPIARRASLEASQHPVFFVNILAYLGGVEDVIWQDIGLANRTDTQSQYNASDNMAASVSKPNLPTATFTQVTLTFDNLRASTDTSLYVDSFCLLNHNLNFVTTSLPISNTINITPAASNGVSSAGTALSITGFTGDGSERPGHLAGYSVSQAAYIDVAAWKFEFSILAPGPSDRFGQSSFIDLVPKVGEAVPAQTFGLLRAPLRGPPKEGIAFSPTVGQRSFGTTRAANTVANGAREITLTYDLGFDSLGQDEKTYMLNFWKLTKFGSIPIVYSPRGDDLSTLYYCRITEFSITEISRNLHRLRMRLEELYPFVGEFDTHFL